VAGNQWTEIIAPDQLEPHLSVTVIIPHYEAPEALAITLAALDRQTYPGHLLDVIVVDDGSVSPPAADPALGMRVQVASQPRRGFGASRARHRGAGMATGDVLVFLDADVVPSEACVAAHARWHHQVADALTIGFRDHVDADAVSLSDVVRHDGPLEELFADHDPEPPAWIEAHMTRTHDLTDDVTDLFRVVTSGNLGMRRDLYHALGGFDGTFSEWGLEDTELGYRAAAVGAVLIPERAAHGWHLGRIIKPRQDRIEGMNRQREAISQLIPDPGFRGPIRPGRSYTVPNVVVSVGTARAAADLVLRSVESILASRYHDLVVWVEDSPEDPTFEWLRRQFTPDPRVAFGHLEDAALAYPASRIHISLPSPAEVGEFSIGDMIGEIDAQAMVEFADNGHVVGRVAPSWATHRSLRTGQRPAELGTTRSVSARIVSSKPLAVTAFARRFTRDPGSSVGRIIKQIRAVRSPRQAWRFGVWALGASRRRLQGVRTPELASKAAVPAEYDLGLTISTVGTEARDVFGASSRVASFDPDRSVDVVLSDTPHVAEAGETPVVAIRDGASPLAVRAFDPESVNPIRWIREHDGVVACLGSPDMLSLSLSAGVVQIGPDAVEAFRSAHHVVDIAEFHESVRQRASTLVALAARGVVISLVDDDANLGEYLGVPLTHALRDPRIAASSHHVRERISIAQRREALRTHSLRSRARQLGAAGAVDAPRLAEVSILLATNRPDYLESALDMVGRQTYPRLELALALHGAGFAGDVEARAKELDLRVRVVRVGQEVAFGDALNLAVSASGGTLLTKFDDDDHYGAEHVWDLVLAHEYSRATLVAKAAEFVYLAGTDATIHRFAGRGETYSETLAGGTMLISRDDLKAVDGWRPVSKGVDKALINAVRKNDGVIYRTHGSGYVLVRHGVGHTWASDDSYFLDQATDQRVGLDLEFAGIE
jgi:GT2 family glycosyltransferase